MIETNRFFLQKEGVNRIVLRYKIGTQSDGKSQTRGSSPQNLPTMPKYGSTPLPLGPQDLIIINLKTHIIKNEINFIAKPLTHIFNLLFTQCLFPDQMKIAKVIAIYIKKMIISSSLIIDRSCILSFFSNILE